MYLIYNRRRPEGWLPPSLKHRVDTTCSWVRRLQNWAPVTEVHIERTAFDVHAMSVGVSLQGIEYQQGTLAGYEVRQYLLEHWGRACAYCGASGVPLQVEHIRPRSRGGSDRVSNLTLACRPCNHAKGSLSVEKFLKDKPRLVARILAHAKAPLRDAAAMNSTRWSLWRRLQELGTQLVWRAHEIQPQPPRLPTGKNSGTHKGRVAVRSTGRFNIRTDHGLVQGVHHRHVRLLQRADGYGYGRRPEQQTGRTSDDATASPDMTWNSKPCR
ncbi:MULTISPECIES: RNA-guided endonuclease IscB [unclassified Streptomyces]|uniref:RNA-guided endonuclease IscB n=1 Tax=unclassified Streptomyces TaxID=2593676 RepID=UPI002366103B|nr:MULTISPECIES: RNA-guided endonuclease IscB [unclassified Streptomyces]MDF3146210.1 RNA-guided endonuclease IscB [Streptomyces sp. T21Q-yed]WDF44630.1 RNA-guided endonuclease IscB [Streptomyces sp. T12]